MNGRPVRIAGVVVLYHPPADVLENIRGYLEPLERLLLVDNSPVASPVILEFARASDRVSYVGDGKNRGIAWALNAGAAAAREAGCEWLLTMDQDSRFEPGGLERLIDAARDSRAGILSPFHKIPGQDGEGAAEAARDVPYVMTSGNLLNLAAYGQTGPFLEKLFIDYVDCEYCLRLRRKGYAVRRVSGSALRHALGETEPRRFLGLDFAPTHHQPVRRYYMTRNRLYVMSRHPLFAVGEAWAWAKEIAKLLLFERDRVAKLRHMARGAADFLRGRYGAFGT